MVANSQASVAESQPIEPQAWPRPAYAWYVVILLLFAYALAIVDRIIIGLLVDDIKSDLQITDTQMGLLQGFAFTILYSLAALPIGFMVDRFNRVRLLAGGITIWSVMTVLSGFSRSYDTLFSARVGVGLGEAAVTPTATSLIGDYFPPEKRARAFGVFMVGGAIGSGLAYLLGGFAIQISRPFREFFPAVLGHLAQWHITFILVGLPGLILTPLILLSMREPVRREKRDVTADKGIRFDLIKKQLRAHPMAYFALFVGSTINIAIVYAQFGWLPAAFMRLYGWSPSQVATTLSLISVPCAVISALSAGWVMSWFAERERNDGPIIVAAAQGAVWAVFGGLKFMMPTPELAVVFHLITTLFGSLAITAALTGIAQITPNELRGQFTALYSLMTGLLAVSGGTLLVGFLSDNLFPGIKGIRMSMTATYVGLGTLGVICLLLGRKAFARAGLEAREWSATE